MRELPTSEMVEALSEWIASGLPNSDPIGLIEIDAALRSAFGEDFQHWHYAINVCVESVVRRGLRPMLPNETTGMWEWTDRFNGESETDTSPADIAYGAIMSWVSYGDSGGAEALRFGTALPTWAETAR